MSLVLGMMCAALEIRHLNPTKRQGIRKTPSTLRARSTKAKYLRDTYVAISEMPEIGLPGTTIW